MVYEIIKSKNKIFLETLIITLSILVIGFSIGFYVESLRIQETLNYYKNFEIEALDLKLQNYYYQIMDETSCDKAIKQNFIFADEIYKTGLIIEQYEEANQISDQILTEKKRYVLLKTELWLNSILLKKKCNNPFHTVAYLYSQNYNQAKGAEQGAISDILKKIKEEQGNKIVLLPIAGDLGIDSVNLQKEIYGITYLPSIIIDEKIVLNGYHTKEDIEKYLV
ncbi:MAG: hypothetical protein NTU63_02340 [Candidatus Pacearchaeota archaeon]|nr:hypothetical protein [Candidatus Pacearchaeota archaeon]